MVTVVVIFYSNRDTTLSKGLEGQIHYPKEVGLPVITRIHASCQIIRNKFTNIISHVIEFAVHLYVLRRINSLAVKAIA